MAKAVALFCEVDIGPKRGCFTGESVDKNTRTALRYWIICRGLTTTVAESYSTFVRRLLTMINWYRRRCDSEISVP